MKFFPIMAPQRGVVKGPRSVPWAFVEPFGRRAELNHGQTLERLAQRGGLSPRELACLVTDQDLRAMKTWLDDQDALDTIVELLNSY